MKARIFASTLLAVSVFAGEHSGTVQSTRLYTPPDLTAKGGIRAVLLLPNAPMQQVFAMPAADPSKVYKGEVRAGGKEFLFHGLPVGKYDLMLLYEDSFYEGFTLTREDDSLTTRDRDSIKTIVNRAVPFFDTKQVHRCAGTTGQAGRARCVLQELRTKLIVAQSAEELKGYQIRSIKLAWLEDVGATGWQLINTRELVRQEVAPEMRKGLLAHHHNPQLSGLRVTDEVKDLGTLNLNQQEAH